MTGKPSPSVGAVLRRNGAFSVYLTALPDGSHAVVKRVEGDDDPVATRRFERERHLLKVLRHPGLPRLVDAGTDWFATGYIRHALAGPGERDRRVGDNSAGEFLYRAAHILAHIHAMGVIHLDIKPSHFLLDADRPVLIDFGIAALRSEDNLSCLEFAGSPAWMAPERFTDLTPAPPSDIWSFGLVGMWLLTGILPYSGGPESILAARRTGVPPKLAWAVAETTANKRLCGALRLCLQPDAAKRPDASSLCAMLK